MFTHVNVLTKKLLGLRLRFISYLDRDYLSRLISNVLQKSFNSETFLIDTNGRCRWIIRGCE